MCQARLWGTWAQKGAAPRNESGAQAEENEIRASLIIRRIVV